MSYADVREGTLRVLRGIEGFGPENVRYSDYEPLNSGMQRAVVVEYGGFSRERSSFQDNYWQDWTLRLILFTPYADEASANEQADTDRQLVLSEFQQWPRLRGGGVFDAVITRGEPLNTPFELGGARWIKETFTLIVREDVSGPAQE